MLPNVMDDGAFPPVPSTGQEEACRQFKTRLDSASGACDAS
jgi:hypothetical protein